jgi:glycosyltransferase involved in cell wall biosynthesis
VRIGFDVTAFYYSRAGVLYYRWRLLQALLREGREHGFVLLNYLPLSQWGELGVALDSLDAPNAQIVACQGIKERKLTRWPPMMTTARRGQLSRRVDSWLEPVWQRIVSWSTSKSLDRALADADVFHCSDVLLHKPRGTRTVVTVHDLSTLLFPQLHLRSTVELHEKKIRFVRQQADLVIAVSENTRRDVIEHLGVPPDRVHMVYEAAGAQFRPIEDTGTIATVVQRYGLTPNNYVLTVGTLEPRKNQTRLVEAFHLLRQRGTAPNLKLVLAGRKGWLYEDLFRRVEELGLTKDVVFAGVVPDKDLPALMNGALMFVYPSLYEGFGLPVLEAMACGLPVITSNLSSLPEIAGNATLLVDPYDVEGLAETMRHLIENEAIRATLCSKGLSQAARFSWEEAAKQTIRIYEGKAGDWHFCGETGSQ